MGKYILAVEVDKIQNFVFRSNKLRQVIGGSQIISLFCKLEKERIEAKYKDECEILIADGGSFRFIIDCKEKAQKIAKELKERFYILTGWQITVAEAIKINNDFINANRKAQESLREAKMQSAFIGNVKQFPLAAVCNYCGKEVAIDVKDGQYICEYCLLKEKEGYFNNLKNEGFLKNYIDMFFEMDLKNKEKINMGMEFSEVADLDPNKKVAFISADGNGMGKVFDALDKEGAIKLSKELSEIYANITASIAQKLYKNDLIRKRNSNNFIPLIPLIMGGDDLFLIMPALFSICAAQEICQQFEIQLRERVEKYLPQGSLPSISVSVVVCNKKYPYYKAAETGKKLLAECKDFIREHRISQSMINFADLSVYEPNFLKNTKFVTSLKPYFYKKPDVGELTPASISISNLLKGYKIANASGFPRSKMRKIANSYSLLDQMYYYVNEYNDPNFNKWQDQLKKEINHSNQSNNIKNLLETLGWEEKNDYFVRLRRNKSIIEGNGILDYIEIENCLEDYRSEEGEKSDD